MTKDSLYRPSNLKPIKDRLLRRMSTTQKKPATVPGACEETKKFDPLLCDVFSQIEDILTKLKAEKYHTQMAIVSLSCSRPIDPQEDVLRVEIAISFPQHEIKPIILPLVTQIDERLNKPGIYFHHQAFDFPGRLYVLYNPKDHTTWQNRFGDRFERSLTQMIQHLIPGKQATNDRTPWPTPSPVKTLTSFRAGKLES